jgi:Domain of unknown function (DUF4129)
MVTAAGPVSRATAQRLARQELSKSIYHPHESLIQWVHSVLNQLASATDSSVPGGWWSAIALIAIAVLVVGVIVNRIGPPIRDRQAPASRTLGGSTALAAREHRALAESYAAAGDYSAATLEFVRALAAELEERSVLAPAPGRTADEFATEAGRLLPDLADGLAAAARDFDEVCYGDRLGTRGGVERLRSLDAAIRSARKPVLQPASARSRPAAP